jgi:hypothetical protein
MSTTLDTYMPYDSGPGSNVSENGWRQFARYFRNDGIVRAVLNGFNTFGDSTGMQIKVDTGECWIQGEWGQNASLKVIPLVSSNPSNPRIDMVVLRNDFVNNNIVIDVLTGTPAGTPTPPVVTQNSSIWEVQLALVTVAANAVTITSASCQFLPTVSENFISGQLRVTNAAAVSTAETAVVTTPSVGLAANTTYRVTGYLQYTASVTGDVFIMRLRDNSVSGAQRTALDLPAIASSTLGPWPSFFSFVFTTTLAITYAACATLIRFSGTGNIVAVPGTYILIEKIIPAAANFTTV